MLNKNGRLKLSVHFCLTTNPQVNVFHIDQIQHSNQQYPTYGEDILHDDSGNPDNKRVPIHQNKVKV